MSTSDEKKEKVLHARISETLDDEIRRKASTLGISVSNLVRNILLNTFGLVEDIVSDSANIARFARGETPAERDERPARPTEPPSQPAPRPVRVLGWQEVVMNVNAVCERCNALLPKGDKGAIAVLDGEGPRSIICLSCLEGTHGNPSNGPAT